MLGGLSLTKSTVASHSWSGPFGHFHHTFLLLLPNAIARTVTQYTDDAFDAKGVQDYARAWKNVFRPQIAIFGRVPARRDMRVHCQQVVAPAGPPARTTHTLMKLVVGGAVSATRKRKQSQAPLRKYILR